MLQFGLSLRNISRSRTDPLCDCPSSRSVFLLEGFLLLLSRGSSQISSVSRSAGEGRPPGRQPRGGTVSVPPSFTRPQAELLQVAMESGPVRSAHLLVWTFKALRPEASSKRSVSTRTPPPPTTPQAEPSSRLKTEGGRVAPQWTQRVENKTKSRRLVF